VEKKHRAGVLFFYLLQPALDFSFELSMAIDTGISENRN
jgi:hypothetical protein